MNEPTKTAIRQLFSEARSLPVYEVGETIEELARKLRKDPREIFKLNSNENFFVPLDFLRRILKETVDEIDPRIYPRDEYRELKQSLSEYLQSSPNQIVIGTGSDDLIDLVSRMTLKKGDNALSISPTFSIYERCVRIQEAYYKPVPLKKDFSLDIEGLLNAVSSRTKLIFICSPNNPTANKFSQQDMEALTERFDGVVAVDEAYVDFSNGSLVDVVDNYENLVVFRTFSKVFGLAGLRLGCAVSNSEFAEMMDERFQMPYNVTLIAAKVALKILQNMNVINEAIDKVKNQRQTLIEALNNIKGVKAFSSETNFVLFKTAKKSETVYNGLINRGVIVRSIGQVLAHSNCLRVTIAPSVMMDRFLKALKEVLS